MVGSVDVMANTKEHQDTLLQSPGHASCNTSDPLHENGANIVLRDSTPLILILISLLLSACSIDKVNSAMNDTSDNSDTGAQCGSFAAISQDMTWLINGARKQSRACGEYGEFPATTTINWNDQLFQAANNHSQDMASNNFFSHTGSDGLNAGARIEATGYTARAWGENISAGRTAAKEVVDAWLASPGHCANIMGSQYTEIGSACVKDSSTNYGTYWTLVLAAPK